MRSLSTLVPLLVAIGLLVAVGTSNFSLSDLPIADRARIDDEQAIRTLMGQLQEAWRQQDMAAFTAHFTREADLVDRHGPWVRRRAEIAEHLTRTRKRDAGDQIEVASTRVLFDAIQMIAPDVALVHEQREESTRKAIATYVLAKQAGRWWVRSFDITTIDTLPGAPPATVSANPQG
jgi:uncharacterized protein (TIGR02246 family)